MTALSDTKNLALVPLQILVRTWPQIMRAVFWPYLLAFALVFTGRSIGAPICFAISPWHFLLVIAFITSVVRISTDTGGCTVFGFAVPHPTWPGEMIVRSIGINAALVMVPAGIGFYLIALPIIPYVVAAESLALKIACLLAMVFGLSTLLGLVIGVGMAKVSLSPEH